MENSIVAFFSALIHNPESGYTLFFNTVLFAIVFTFFYGIYVIGARWTNVRVYLLLLFSLYFFYHFNGLFILLLLITSIVDYGIGIGISQTPKDWQKRLFAASAIGINVGLLVYFKYTFFFAQTFETLFQLPVDAKSFANSLMPIGLSFYTFKSVSYLLDVYYDEPPEKNYFYYLTYLSFFPTTLAGPIIRSTDLLPQLHQPKPLEHTDVSRALYWFMLGLIKKMIIADYLLINLVDRVYDNPTMFTGFENLMATLGFGIQLYFDFSGYSLMAAGIALALGYEITLNFNEPLKSLSISEFWRRWHISLSSWFNDYVFMPLNFSLRKWGKVGTVCAILTTFLLSGLWHGANWTFVLWGLAHGLVLSYEAITQKLRLKLQGQFKWAYRILAAILVHLFLAFTYILFKSDNLREVEQVLNQIFYYFAPEVALEWLNTYSMVALAMFTALIFMYLPTRWKNFTPHFLNSLHWSLQAVVLFLVVVLVYQVRAADLQPFAYLKF